MKLNGINANDLDLHEKDRSFYTELGLTDRQTEIMLQLDCASRSNWKAGKVVIESNDNRALGAFMRSLRSLANQSMIFQFYRVKVNGRNEIHVTLWHESDIDLQPEIVKGSFPIEPEINSHQFDNYGSLTQSIYDLYGCHLDVTVSREKYFTPIIDRIDLANHFDTSHEMHYYDWSEFKYGFIWYKLMRYEPVLCG